MQAREAHELTRAAEAAGLAVRPLAFGSPLADVALAAHGPGSIRLPLAIVAGRYSLQRPALGAVLECIEVLRRTRQTLPAGCVVVPSAADLDGREQPAIEPGRLISFHERHCKAQRRPGPRGSTTTRSRDRAGVGPVDVQSTLGE